MMFFSSSSWKRGVDGKSSVKSMNRVVSLCTDAASSNRKRSPASAFAVMAWDSTFSFPWKILWI